MDTIQELFEEYMKSYDITDFDERAVSEMRLCFFAGAAAMQAITKEIALRYQGDKNINKVLACTRAVDRELLEFMRELKQSDRIRVN